MKDREIQCIHYISEKNCALGKEGTFRKACQHCASYKALKGGRPARKNLKREKNEKFMKDERNWR